jgi:Flp pilus assembly pilin Flp
MRIRRYTKNRRGAGMVEYGLIVGLIAVGAIVAVDRTGQSVESLMTAVASSLGTVQNDIGSAGAGGPAAGPASPVGPGLSGTSCTQILSSNPGAVDGVYRIDPDLDGSHFDAYCDMTTEGGGWTLVAAAFENDQLFSWGEGIQADYDPTLASGASFTLAESDLPDHDQVGFGRDHLPTDVDHTTAADGFRYTTGDIPLTTVAGASGKTYHLHREVGAYYGGHEPDDGIGAYITDGTWEDTLALDETGVDHGHDWIFVRSYFNSNGRGYAYGGQSLVSTHETFAWTVWVR